MVTPGEAALADDALEGFRAGVLAVVPRQLVGPRETPLALGPLAGVRLFTCEEGRERESGRKVKCLLGKQNVEEVFKTLGGSRVLFSYMGMQFWAVNIDREYLNLEQAQALRFEFWKIHTKIT